MLYALSTWLVLIFFATPLCADYLWPLPYGKELSSSFGDWRTRHYHAGLDIRTGGAVGRPVVAPADGYVMRLSTSYYGYGKALYFAMPDGNVAVFGHLDHFRPEVEDYVAKEQIASQSYNQNLILDAARFRYHRGDTICFSGQSGVGAPHLHFEIRTANNEPLNPLGFDGLKVSDTQPPEFRRLRLIGKWNDDLERALGRKRDYLFLRKPTLSTYVLNDTIECDDDGFWLSVEAVDRVGTSTWLKPIYSLELRQGDRLLYRLTYDTLSFDDTYLIDMERNYQMAVHGASDFYNLVSRQQVQSDEGVCRDAEGAISSLTLIARDVAGNESRAIIPIRHVSQNSSTKKMKPEYARLAALLQRYGAQQEDISYAFIPNGEKLCLLVRQLRAAPVEFRLSSSQSPSQSILLKDIGGGFALGVVDSEGSRDFLNADGSFSLIKSSEGSKEAKQSYTITTGFRRAWSGDVQAEGKVVSPDSRLQILLPPVEQVYFPLDRQYYFDIEATKSARSAEYTVVPDEFPLAKQVTILYGFDQMIPRGVGLYLGKGEKPSFLGAENDSAGNSITAKSYRVGIVSMRIDTIAPAIREISPSANASVSSARPKIRCRIDDNLSGIRDSVEVRIDGRWCIPVYDPEEGTLISTPHFDLTSGKHRLDIKVTDRVGNQRH
ncbi:MAG: M23 family metallopeptidase, partial [candidate division Zixibacteria bacterium]|nr:M23 family metallopeptidase [candidate division Zixibacteria bacterium]